MPLDYFSPNVFNTLQPELRAHISTGKIGLPSDISDAFTKNANEMLSDLQLVFESPVQSGLWPIFGETETGL